MPSVAEINTRPPMIKVLLAFAAIYLVWGTTYLAMRICVETIPPFSVAGWRFLLAGLLLIGWLGLRGVALPTLRQWRSAALIGCLLMLGGNGLVCLAVQKIPSGLCAVVIATLPLWMALFDWLFYGGPRIDLRICVGILLGMVGIVLLFDPIRLLAGESTLHLPSLLVLMCAPIFWSIGSL